MRSVWQNLNHEVIFKALEEVLGEKLSNLIFKRSSYINRVYELEKYDHKERFVVKFYRPYRWTKEMIETEYRFLFALAQKEISVIAPLKIKGETLFSFDEYHFAIFPKKWGRVMDEFDEDGLEELGRLVARVHLVGEKFKDSTRLLWRPEIATRTHLKTLINSQFLLRDFSLPFQNLVEAFIKRADPYFNEKDFILIHGDCHKLNLIHRPNSGGIFLIDFDDIVFGPPIQDLWMLLSGNISESERELDFLLKGYETFRSFDYNSLKLIPFLRGMRLIHFAAWQAIQAEESDFSTHFPEAGSSRYWNELMKELQEITYN